jgi:hypothetical protein
MARRSGKRDIPPENAGGKSKHGFAKISSDFLSSFP